MSRVDPHSYFEPLWFAVGLFFGVVEPSSGCADRGHLKVLSSFPETAFPPPAELRAGYEERVAAGRERMREVSVVICGLARDVCDALPNTVARIERQGEMFRDYRVIIYENDSQDGTLGYLWAWRQENPAVVILTERLGNPRWGQVPDPTRAAQMAYYRNQYLRYALSRYGDFDFLLGIDLDLPDGWSYDGVANTFGHEGWDMVGSYGIQHVPYAGRRRYPVFFDVWAFREVGHPKAHVLKEINPRVYRRGQPLLPVWSCFGGLGVYRMEALRSGCEYDGGDCEHVTLHRAMRERGFDHLFMNPSQIVLHPKPRNATTVVPLATTSVSGMVRKKGGHETLHARRREAGDD